MWCMPACLSTRQCVPHQYRPVRNRSHIQAGLASQPVVRAAGPADLEAMQLVLQSGPVVYNTSDSHERLKVCSPILLGSAVAAQTHTCTAAMLPPHDARARQRVLSRHSNEVLMRTRPAHPCRSISKSQALAHTKWPRFRGRRWELRSFCICQRWPSCSYFALWCPHLTGGVVSH